MADTEIPSHDASPSDRLNWLLDAQTQGEAWLQAQRPTTAWEGVRDRLSRTGDAAPLSGQSNLDYPKTKRTIREIVASLSNFRHEGEFQPRWDKDLYQNAYRLTELDDDWYRRCKTNQRIREVVQYGVAFGTGYFWQTWDKHFHGPAQGDIKLKAVGPANVTFVQMPDDHDIQKTYVTIVREELPIATARAMFDDTNPGFARSLQPDRGNPSWLIKGLRKVQQFLAPALRVGGLTQEKQTGSYPTVDIFHAYIRDASVNDTGEPVVMGTPGTNWSYTVPAIGDPIPIAMTNPQTGQPYTRPATADDCRMYPFLRYCIYSRSGIAYDGPAPYWHARVPVARVRFCDWAWEALGGSTAAEILPIEDGIIAIMRLIEDSAAARMDPPVLYDDNFVSSTFVDAFNPRRAGARAAANLNQGKVLEYPVDPHTYDIGNWIPEWVAAQEARMDYLSGVTDLVAIAKAKQVPGADTLEKLMEMAGPIVQDMVRALEEPLTELGQQRLALFFQFYTRPRVITVLGPDGKYVPEQFSLDPFAPPIQGESPELYAGRRRKLLDDYAYNVSESGINEIHRMTTKLFYLQLMKSGFPIDWWTMADIAKVANFGPKPEGTNNVMERFVAQQRIVVELAAYQGQLAASMGVMQPGGEVDGQGKVGSGEMKPGGTGQQGPGRPNANTAPPKIESKDGGTRSTVTTS
jgi:hypothetical protein